MPRNNAEYGSRHNTEYEDEDKNDHRNLDLRGLTGKDPAKHNDLIIEAFKDLGYSTRDFAKPESYPKVPQRPRTPGKRGKTPALLEQSIQLRLGNVQRQPDLPERRENPS